uniref:Uncharacterized protein n=1 Tax=Pseudonaja textilis TaxID=8673 RepID=A0A670Z6F0_PSETE
SARGQPPEGLWSLGEAILALLEAQRNLGRLRFVFGTSVVPALDLVDRQSVTRFVSPSGRAVYQRRGIRIE